WDAMIHTEQAIIEGAGAAIIWTNQFRNYSIFFSLKKQVLFNTLDDTKGIIIGGLFITPPETYNYEYKKECSWIHEKSAMEEKREYKDGLFLLSELDISIFSKQYCDVITIQIKNNVITA
ncbi:hypothetical protein ACJX0J_038713, partial [Zea mays]